MKVAELCSVPAFVAHADQSLAAAAREMRDHDVGALIVIDPGDPGRRPVGILTDRDIVCGQVARCADLHCLTVGEVMTRDPLTVAADAELNTALEAMSSRAVRRAPVTSPSGALVGVVTLDDLLPVFAEELHELASILDLQARRAHA